MAKVRVENHEHGFTTVSFFCPACNHNHSIVAEDLNEEYPVWGFNWNTDCPTFTPSVRVQYTYGEERRAVCCHMFVTDGYIQYLSDCTHFLAGQTVPMHDIAD